MIGLRSAVALSWPIVVAAVVIGTAGVTATAAAAAPACRGPEELAGSFRLGAERRISIKRVTCAPAKRVVTSFAKRCYGAYSSQGSCTFRSQRRWTCASKLVGSAAAGSPSVVTCRAGRRQVRFTVTFRPPSRDGAVAGAAARAAQPLARAAELGAPAKPCGIDTNAAAKRVPPAPAPNDTFEIRTQGLVPVSFGASAQAQMVSRGVAARLTAGLGVRPRGYPLRVPIFFIPGQNEGATSQFCDGSPREASVVGIDGRAEAAAQTTAHELVHVYASAIDQSGTAYPWFEDALAEWSLWKAGWYAPPGPQQWDHVLQDPEKPVDELGPNEGSLRRYAMWRFVQFLEDTGKFLASDGSWPLARGVSAGGPAYTATLDTILTSQGASLGESLAAFWGEHLKAQPKRPPRLVPAHGINSRLIEIEAGTTTITASTYGLSTSLDDFRLAADVRRVEFEFEPPADGYFWGLVAANDSRRFRSQETISFCVAAPDADDLLWPGNFPVTFTNGALGNSSLRTGSVKVFAQTNAGQCTNPASNRACRVLVRSGARDVLGAVALGPRGGAGLGEDGRRYEQCSYGGHAGFGILRIVRWSSSRQLRAFLKRKHDVSGWQYVRLGDLAIALSASGKQAFVQIAVGRELVSVSVTSEGGSMSQAMTLARAVVRNVR